MPAQVYSKPKQRKNKTTIAIILTAFAAMIILTAFLVYKANEISKLTPSGQPAVDEREGIPQGGADVSA